MIPSPPRAVAFCLIAGMNMIFIIYNTTLFLMYFQDVNLYITCWVIYNMLFLMFVAHVPVLLGSFL